MVEFEEKVSRAMTDLGINPGDNTGVALSGGADSLALLISLSRLGYKVTALHCDFSLRGEESDADREYCTEVTKNLGIDLLSVKFDTRNSRLPGESLEMTCRRLRYDWFETQAQKYNLDYIALGHHIEDSIETMFLNLTRGTGPKGMSGISPRRGLYIRPMLNISRAEIEKYLADLAIPFRTDSTNLTNDYRRNAIRNILLPTLYDIIPTAQSGLLRTADAMRHSTSMIDTYLRWCKDKYYYNGKLDIDAMHSDNIDVTGTLFMIIPRIFGCDTGMEIITQIVAVPDNKSSRLFPAGDGRQFELFRGKLQLYKELSDEEYEVSLENEILRPVHIKVTVTDFPEFQKSQKENDTIWLDGSILTKPHRFTLRHRRDGDRIRPFGASGRKLISDIFTDMKLSRSDKNDVFILTMDEEPLWIVGIRASNSFRVTENSKKIIKLQLINEDAP